MNKIKKKVKCIITKNFVMDMLFLIGVLIITLTNFVVNKYFGCYFTGAELIAFSIFLSITKKK